MLRTLLLAVFFFSINPADAQQRSAVGTRPPQPPADSAVFADTGAPVSYSDFPSAAGLNISAAGARADLARGRRYFLALKPQAVDEQEFAELVQWARRRQLQLHIVYPPFSDRLLNAVDAYNAEVKGRRGRRVSP